MLGGTFSVNLWVRGFFFVMTSLGFYAVLDRLVTKVKWNKLSRRSGTPVQEKIHVQFFQRPCFTSYNTVLLTSHPQYVLLTSFRLYSPLTEICCKDSSPACYGPWPSLDLALCFGSQRPFGLWNRSWKVVFRVILYGANSAIAGLWFW